MEGKALRMSHKTYAVGCKQNTVELHLSKAFSGSKEMEDTAPRLYGRAALEAAKRKRVHQQASLKSELICGNGEGRATREFELIWSPIYDSSGNGMLTLRICWKSPPLTLLL